jgi:hypothetical protein
MERAVIFVLRHKRGWRIVIGEQRIGAYDSAEAACWAAMSLAMHLRGEGASVELRLHDDTGIRRLWPPELATEPQSKRPSLRRIHAA